MYSSLYKLCSHTLFNSKKQLCMCLASDSRLKFPKCLIELSMFVCTDVDISVVDIAIEISEKYQINVAIPSIKIIPIISN